MMRSSVVGLCLVTGVFCGYIDISHDHVVNEIPADQEDTLESPKDIQYNHENHEERAVDIGSKDILTQLAVAGLLKIYTLVPLLLGTLGLVAGVAVASSKVAFLVVAAIAVYSYISEHSILPTGSKDVDWGQYLRGWSPVLPAALPWYELQLQQPLPNHHHLPHQQQVVYQDHSHQPRIVIG